MVTAPENFVFVVSFKDLGKVIWSFDTQTRIAALRRVQGSWLRYDYFGAASKSSPASPRIERPPSITSVEPVTKAASSEAR